MNPVVQTGRAEHQMSVVVYTIHTGMLDQNKLGLNTPLYVKTVISLHSVDN